MPGSPIACTACHKLAENTHGKLSYCNKCKSEPSHENTNLLNDKKVNSQSTSASFFDEQDFNSSSSYNKTQTMNASYLNNIFSQNSLHNNLNADSELESNSLLNSMEQYSIYCRDFPS